MERSEFDNGYEAGLRKALEAVHSAHGVLYAEDNDRRGFQKACYDKAIDMAVKYVAKELAQITGVAVFSNR